MVKLLAQWSTKISWSDYSEWIYDSKWSFLEDFDGIFCLTKSSGSTNPIYKTFLTNGRKYRFSFTLLKNIETNQFNKGVSIDLGSNIVSATSEGDHSLVVTCNNGGICYIRPVDLYAQFSLKNLIIEEIGYSELDIYEDSGIALNFSIADIKDYGKRKGTYSKLFTIPGTINNNNFFKWVFNINEENIFNINHKCRALLIYSENNFIEGFITLENIYLNDNKIEYEVCFFGDQLNLFIEAGNDRLEDLDFSDLTHIASYKNIVDSFAFPNPPANSGYCYPWIDYGANKTSPIGGVVGSATDSAPSVGLTVADVYPAISVKAIIDKIFKKYGYKYQSSIFSSQDFKRLIIPYVNKEELLHQWYLVSKSIFNYSYPNITQFFCGDAITNITTFVGQNGGKYSSNWMRCDKDGIVSYYYEPGWGYISIVEGIDINGRSLERYRRFNYGPWVHSNISPPVTLPAGQAKENNPNKYQVNYNHIPGSYLVKKSGKYKISVTYNIQNVAPYAGTAPTKALLLYACKVNQAACEFEYNSTPTANKWRIKDPATANEEVKLLRQFTTSSGIETSEWTFDNCEEGDMLYFKWVGIGLIDGWYASCMSISVYEYGWGEDCIVPGSALAPRNVKIVDFLKDLITLYNLYIEVDENDPKKLLIEPRDTYYTLGKLHDWTYKLDLSSKIEISSNRDFLSKVNKFKYADDDDENNTMYKELKDPQDVGYGGHKVVIDSDLLEGESVISLDVFAPTPLVDVEYLKGPSGKTNFVISQILKGDYKTPNDTIKYLEWKPRILIYQTTKIYDNSNLERKWRFCRITKHVTSNGIDYEYFYPYAGHIKYPFDLKNQNNLDLNFDTKLYTGNLWQKTFTGDSDSITKINQFNLYYRKFFSQISSKDSRLIKAYFYLTPNDIANLKFNDIIFVNGTYYIINKIIDFNPDGKSLTQVELLKIIDNVNLTQQIYQSNDNNLSTIVITPKKSYISIGDYNIKPSNTTGILIGDGNNDNTRSSIIVGSGNNVSSKSAVISSDNSTLKSSATIINSDSIIIESGLTNVTVIGENNLTIEESDVAFINGLKIKNGHILLSEGVIDGGIVEIDGVFNPYKFNRYHINDCGENEIDPFSIYISNVIDGGLYKK